MTLIHEYAHCLDYNNSISEGRVYKVDYGELELASGTDFVGNPIEKEELKRLADLKRSGIKKPTLLSTHEEYFVKALSNILEAGRIGKIPLMNQIEEQAHQIELEVGGSHYADKKRSESRVKMMEMMKDKLALLDTPYIRIAIPEHFIKFLQNTELSYIGELGKTQYDLDMAIKLIPHIEAFKEFLKDKMYLNPQKNSKSLNDMLKLDKEVQRLIKRQTANR